MKIAFLTSSLEPGRDGVGDYVRMLAAEFTRRGHPSVVLALNDRLCSAIVESGNELRLPESAPWSERSAAAKRLLRAFGPDWISLHFVAFGYNARGVPLQWPGRFQELCGGACVHLMFHELWLGLAAEASTKHKLIGALQRHCFSKMVQKLQPKFVTTSNRAYAALLGTIGVAASVLPMFGAIPLEDVSENGCSEVSSDSSRLNVVIFGSLHPEWPPEPLLTHLRGAAAKLQRKLAFISVGNIGPGETLWQSMVSRYSDMEFLRLGPRSTA
ncbi:MAG TPA: hypothetical protein VEJ63_15990, partial [Planctomycetota bacterium]|nr:hypothetical protein [Planctomycetota bacterium]